MNTGKAVSIGKFPQLNILHKMGETRHCQWNGFSVKALKNELGQASECFIIFSNFPPPKKKRNCELEILWSPKPHPTSPKNGDRSEPLPGKTKLTHRRPFQRVFGLSIFPRDVFATYKLNF